RRGHAVGQRVAERWLHQAATVGVVVEPRGLDGQARVGFDAQSQDAGDVHDGVGAGVGPGPLVGDLPGQVRPARQRTFGAEHGRDPGVADRRVDALVVVGEGQGGVTAHHERTDHAREVEAQHVDAVVAQHRLQVAAARYTRYRLEPERR